MGQIGPIPWLILGAVVLLLFGGSWQGVDRIPRDSRFFSGVIRVSAFALSGALLLALSLLIDVYGTQWAPGADSDGLSLGLSAAGGVFVIVSMILDRRSRKDRG